VVTNLAITAPIQWNFFLRQGVPNIGGKVVAGLKIMTFQQNSPLLVGFKGQTRAQKTRALRPRLSSPRLALKTH
jgi:hypothetical protein